MRSKSEIKTTKHIVCEQENCLDAYANIDLKKIIFVERNAVLSQN